MSIAPQYRSVLELVQQLDARAERGEHHIPVRLRLHDGSVIEGEFFATKADIVAVVGPRAKDFTEVQVADIRAVSLGRTALGRYAVITLATVAAGLLIAVAYLTISGDVPRAAVPIGAAGVCCAWLVARLVTPIRRWVLRWTPAYPLRDA